MGFNEAQEETAQLAVRGVRPPARLEDPEQSAEYVGQHGPQRHEGTFAQKSIAKLMFEKDPFVCNDARLGNDAKRVQVRCARWMMRTVFT